MYFPLVNVCVVSSSLSYLEGRVHFSKVRQERNFSCGLIVVILLFKVFGSNDVQQAALTYKLLFLFITFVVVKVKFLYIFSQQVCVVCFSRGDLHNFSQIDGQAFVYGDLFNLFLHISHRQI